MLVDALAVEAVGHAAQLQLAVERLIGDAEQGAVGDAEAEAVGGDGGGLHVDPHTTDASEIFFEYVVVLPDAAVSGVDGAGPVIAVVIADGGRDCFLEREGRERRDLGREVIGRCSFSSNGGNGQDQVPDTVGQREFLTDAIHATSRQPT